MGWRNAPVVEPGYLRAPPVEQPTGPQPVGRGERFMMGIMDPIVGGGQLLERMTPEPIRGAINAADAFLFDRTGGVLGSPGGADLLAREREADYQTRMAAAGQTGFDGVRLTGNILSPINWAAATTRIPATTVGAINQGILLGGAYGALQPVTGQDPDDFLAEKLAQTSLGAITGGVTQPLLGPVARAGQRGQSRDVSLLMSEGVNPTPAQIMGGAARRAEDKLTSWPIVGAVATRNQRKALEQFNEAAINRAVTPVGGQVKGTGREAVVDAQRILDDAYDRARTAVVNPVDFDPAFVSQIADLDTLGAGLTGEMQGKLRGFMTQNMGARLNAGRVTADQFKEIDSALSQQISKFGRSKDPAQQEYADVLREIQRGLNDQMARTNPDAATLFRQADDGYRHLVIVENATNASAAPNGVFTPHQLQIAARAADDSVRKRDTIRGTATFADLAQAGQNVLGNRYPDSGTAGRGLFAMGGAGLGYGLSTAPTTTGLLLGGAGLGALGYAGAQPLARFAMTNPALARTLQAVPTTGAAVAGGQGAGISGLLMDR